MVSSLGSSNSFLAAIFLLFIIWEAMNQRSITFTLHLSPSSDWSYI